MKPQSDQGDRPGTTFPIALDSGTSEVRELRPSSVRDAVVNQCEPAITSVTWWRKEAIVLTLGKNFYRWSSALAFCLLAAAVAMAWPEPALHFLKPSQTSARFSICLPDLLIVVWLLLASTLIVSAGRVEAGFREVAFQRWGVRLDDHPVLALRRVSDGAGMAVIAIILVAAGPWGGQAAVLRGLLLATCFYYAGIGLSAMFVVYRHIQIVCEGASRDSLLFHADRLAGLSPLSRYADRSSLAILSGAFAVPMAISIIQANVDTITSAPARSYFDMALAIGLLLMWTGFSFAVSLLGRIAISARLQLLQDTVLLDVAQQKGRANPDAASLEVLDRREKAALNLRTGIVSAGWWKDLLGMSGPAATAIGWLLSDQARSFAMALSKREVVAIAIKQLTH